MHQRGFPAVEARMTQNWKAQAEHWAWWGRMEVIDLEAHTNNGSERWVGCGVGGMAGRGRQAGTLQASP